MKILFINQCYWPDHVSTAQHLTDLAEELASHGHEVAVVASAHPYVQGETVFARRECHNGVSIYRVRTLGFGKERGVAKRLLDSLIFLMKAFFRCWRVPQPDIVVTLTSPPLVGVIGWLVSWGRKAKHVHWCMDVFPEMAVAGGVMRRDGLLYKFCFNVRSMYLRSCTSVIALGDSMAAYLKQYCTNGTSLDVVPVWSDGREIKPIPRESNWFRDRHGLQDKFVVMYSGNLVLSGDLDTLVSAFAALCVDPDIAIVVISEGPQFAALRRIVQERGLHNVVFLPYQDRRDLSYSLSAADVHIVTNKAGLQHFRVPGKAYGIMAAGRPIVHLGETRGDVPELLFRHKIGFSVREGDVSNLAARIRELKRDSHLWAEMGARARAVFEAHYDRVRSIRLIEEIMLRAIGAADSTTALSGEQSFRKPGGIDRGERHPHTQPEETCELYQGGSAPR